MSTGITGKFQKVFPITKELFGKVPHLIARNAFSVFSSS
jgi:hypothetical protein